MKRPSRDPGERIKSQLRAEVNYGCPVRYRDGTGCGSPILTFHHFDPPWSGNYVHNLDGMIALCPEHHQQADAGLWTTEQLRDYKKSPYVDDVLRVRWPWQPKTMAMKVGPSLVVGSGSPIRLDGLPIMRFYPRDIEALGSRTIIFESDIRDANGKRWLHIDDGWFDLRLEGITDVRFTPQTRNISARRDDNTYISLRYIKYSLREFRDWTPTFMTSREIAESANVSIEKSGAVDSDGNVPVVIIEGCFRTDKVSIGIKGHSMFFESYIPGLRESFYWHSWVVDDTRRAIMKIKHGAEFFSLG